MEFSRARVFGPWTLTIQPDLPIYWINCPPIGSYFMRLNVSFGSSAGSDECKAGVILHARGNYGVVDEVDSCVISSDGLNYRCSTSNRSLMRCRSDDEWHIVVDKGNVTLFIRERKCKLKTSFKYQCGRIGLFNHRRHNVTFTNVVITSFNR